MDSEIMGSSLLLLFKRTAGISASANWWLSGGISPSLVVAAYTAKGAGNLGNAKINQANPGVYDLTTLVANPAWTNDRGLIFAGVLNEILDTGYRVQSNNVTVFVRTGNAVSGWAWGSIDGVTTVDGTTSLSNVAPNDIWRAQHGGTVSGASPSRYSGSLSFCGNNVYINGIFSAAVPAGGVYPVTQNVYVGGRNLAGAANGPLTGDIQYLAVYSNVLTGPQHLALHNATS